MSAARSSRSPRRWTLAEAKTVAAASPDGALAAALAALGVEGTCAEKKAKRKRRGVEVSPLIAAQRTALPHVSLSGPGDPLVLALWFEGARVLTVNELFSVLQTRKHETFRYKKAARAMVSKALARLAPAARKRAWFDGPTRLTLFRQGRRQIDLDSLATVFKYAIDTLRQEKIIDDDNPEVIVEIKLIQTRGAPSLGMRLERLAQWERPATTDDDVFRAWFGTAKPWTTTAGALPA